jgi:hypothetical protein
VNVRNVRVSLRRPPAPSGTRTQATTSSLATSSPAHLGTTVSIRATSLPQMACPAGPTEETMLKDVLEANSSRCREGPSVSL